MTVPSPVVPLLVPDLPDRHALWPLLERMDGARQYSNFGPMAVELEERLAARFIEKAGAPVFVTTTSSATLGLELSLAALRLAPGARVLVPAFTFVATATAVIRAGHIPVVADIDPLTWMLTPALAEAALAEDAFDAVMTVSAFGQAQSFALWQAFSRRHGVPVIIDAAGAFGSQWCLPQQAGADGDADTADVTLVFSLHTTKSLPAGEGGLVVSNSHERIREVRRQSNFGIHLAGSAPAGMVGSSDLLGTNAKLSEYHAAVGLASLARWDERAAVRRGLMRRYRSSLDEAGGGRIVWPATERIAAPTLLCIRWPGAGHADRLERICAQRGVMTRRWYQPLLHRQPVASGRLLHLPTPVADAMAPELIGLPFFPDMRDEQLALVARCVAECASECTREYATEGASEGAQSRATASASVAGTALRQSASVSASADPSRHGFQEAGVEPSASNRINDTSTTSWTTSSSF